MTYRPPTYYLHLLDPGWLSKVAVGKEALEQALDGLDADGYDPKYVYWVDSRYTGGDGNGSPAKPFTSIQDAINAGWNDWAKLAWGNIALVVIAPGTYDVADLKIYPMVALVGWDADSTEINCSGNLSLYSFGYYFIHNLKFMGNWSLQMTSNSYFGWDTWVRWFNCRFETGTMSGTGRGAGKHWLEFHDCDFKSDWNFDLTNVSITVRHPYGYAGASTIKSSNAAAYTFTGKDSNLHAGAFYLYDGFWSGDLTAQQIDGTKGVWVELAGRHSGAVTIDAANGVIETTADGYPENGMTLQNGAIQWPSGNALGLKYDPANPAAWAGTAPPETVGEAIDRLIANNPGA